MTAQVVNFQENNRIRDARVTAIQAHFNFPKTGITADSESYSPTDRPLFTNEMMQSAYLTLVNANGTEIVSKMALSHLQRGPYDQEPLAVNWTQIDLTQSSVQVPNTAWNNIVDGTNYSIVLDFFIDCNACGVSI